ncbi:amino acid/polyamine transporter I [Aspergillus nidulans var. acristatus]
MDKAHVKPPKGDTSVEEQDLAAMGHVQALSRKFNLWSMLALAFCVLGTYSTFAQGLSSGLTNGASITILWGLVLVTVCNLCVAVSLGELTSSMPTALGQAYWVCRLWDTPFGRFLSYMTAWINTFGWWTLTASQVAFMTEFLLGMKTMFDPDWDGADKGWLQFVVYIAVVFVLTLTNVVSCRSEQVLPWLNNFVGVWFTALFIILSLALLISVSARSDLSFQPASFVFGQWMNRTGWPDGVVWFTGLVQAAYGLTAFDAVIHMVEEMPSPRRNAPRVIWLAVILGAITGFIFMLICLFCVQDVNSVVDANLPFIELMQETVGLQGAAVLLALFIFNGLGQGISILTTASRLTWGFARDGGLPFSPYLAHIDTTWKAPVRALWMQGFLIALVGVLYLFASTVLDAILSVSTIALTVSYGIPIAALLFVGRDTLPPGPFRLGRWGALVNWISIVYCIVTTVFFFFPGSPDPKPADMNYAIAVFGVMLVVAIGFWWVQGKKMYLRTEDAMAQMIFARRLEGEGAGVGVGPAEKNR